MKDITINQNILQHESAFSEKVWLGVASGLEREKKKKRIIIWFTSIFFALMVLTLASYFSQSWFAKSPDIKYEIRNQSPEDNAPIP